MQSLLGEHVSRGAPNETVPPADYWNAKVGQWGVYAQFLACIAMLVQSEAAVERGYWRQKRLMNPLRSRLQNATIRDEMRILLNGAPCPALPAVQPNRIPSGPQGDLTGLTQRHWEPLDSISKQGLAPIKCLAPIRRQGANHLAPIKSGANQAPIRRLAPIRRQTTLL